jgi:hypothetical protein
VKRTLLATILLLALAARASALMVEVPFEELVQTSDAIVQGTVVDLESRWLAEPHIIVTDVTLQVGEVWAGSLQPGQRLVLRVAGGEVDGIGMRREHEPAFGRDEQVVLFLAATPSARFAVHHLEQGKFTVFGDQAIGAKGQSLPLAALREAVGRLAPRRER